ncbi:MAG: radical SAM protein [Desulfocapsaceae bacterium]|nr:radical SAM protein [Desulfocapsaceae bacterium]
MRIHPNLPIYFLDQLAIPVLYCPGTVAVVERRHAEMIRQAWQEGVMVSEDPLLGPQMQWLTDHAHSAIARRNFQLNEAFAPECLIVYLSNQCNLRCSYCFAAAANGRGHDPDCGPYPLIDVATFAAAAELVAQNCHRKNKPFRLVVHGGGEPTLHGELLHRLVQTSKRIAAASGLAWTGFIATNGMLSLQQAQWLGATFQHIGLSCDGPPDIQDHQRPQTKGGGSSKRVRQTARAIVREGAHLEIRATITAGTVERQKEILDYLVGVLGAQSIRFEPAYILEGQARPGWTQQDAGRWAKNFMEARRSALSQGAELGFSGIRLHELHGPYRNVLRQALHLTPDGHAVACFFCIDGQDLHYADRIIGRFDRKERVFRLEMEKAVRLRSKSHEIPEYCQNCFASFHCSRSCPESCSTARRQAGADAPRRSFRCRLNEQIGLQLIEQAALELLAEEIPSRAFNTGSSWPESMRAVLAAVPADIREAIRESWQSIEGGYHLEDRNLPQPLWRERGFCLDGEATWNRLKAIPAEVKPSPISVYIHIPFCNQRCGFCDCHALPVDPAHRLRSVYVEGLLREMGQWASLPGLAARPVTTVHFGGGTPNSLAQDRFNDIVSTLAGHFNTSGETEWAIETTAALISDHHLACLRDRGFRRLHVGVQTMEEPLRTAIGRQEATKSVLARLEICLDRGFISTVDLLYGLPGETVSGFLAGLQQLISLGIHGISLYRFNRSRRNRRFVGSDIGRYSDVIHDYCLFIAADKMLLQAGYRKNHFCHYARAEDRNLYYTHARRGEDLLAVGASADGVFGGLHYRCPPLSGKAFQHDANFPLLEGGVDETASERRLNPLIAQLISGALMRDPAEALGLSVVRERWQRQGLIEKGELGRITGNGSWFINAMIREAKEAFAGSNNVFPV